MIVTRPFPPESTTPASFSTGSISGVRSRVSFISWMTFSKNSAGSSLFGASCTAFSAPALATVRIVPSFGFITALYAESTAFSKAFPSTYTSASSTSRSTRVKPRNNWERITPEFPRAPRRDPLEIALQIVSIEGSSKAATSSAADIIVIVILVPVSPSGTGKTFNSLMYSFFA